MYLSMAEELFFLTVAGIISALFFDFVNGFHDSANAIATVVGTRALKPLHAVSIAAIANFIGPFIFGTAVAATVGKGIIKPEFATTEVILAGLFGAIVWNVVTWYFGLPSSSSHALVGGLVGAGTAKGGLAAIVSSGVIKTTVFIFAAPLLGMVMAIVMVVVTSWLFKPVAANTAD